MGYYRPFFTVGILMREDRLVEYFAKNNSQYVFILCCMYDSTPLQMHGFLVFSLIQ